MEVLVDKRRQLLRQVRGPLVRTELGVLLRPVGLLRADGAARGDHVDVLVREELGGAAVLPPRSSLAAAGAAEEVVRRPRSRVFGSTGGQDQFVFNLAAHGWRVHGKQPHVVLQVL